MAAAGGDGAARAIASAASTGGAGGRRRRCTGGTDKTFRHAGQLRCGSVARRVSVAWLARAGKQCVAPAGEAAVGQSGGSAGRRRRASAQPVERCDWIRVPRARRWHAVAADQAARAGSQPARRCWRSGAWRSRMRVRGVVVPSLPPPTSPPTEDAVGAGAGAWCVVRASLSVCVTHGVGHAGRCVHHDAARQRPPLTRQSVALQPPRLPCRETLILKI